MQNHFCVKETALFSCGEDGRDVEHRLKQMSFTLILHFLRRFDFDNTYIICNWFFRYFVKVLIISCGYCV